MIILLIRRLKLIPRIPPKYVNVTEIIKADKATMTEPCKMILLLPIAFAMLPYSTTLKNVMQLKAVNGIAASM